MGVFANGLGVSGKAVNARTIAAFPDVCFTPPENPATPPGTPVPYPSFGFASDTEKGTGTVFIGGEIVNIKNLSDEKRTTGTEAGCAAKKGIITSENTGKKYFHKWSPNVKFESEPVIRYTDLASHNHASPGGNITGIEIADRDLIPYEDGSSKLCSCECEELHDEEFVLAQHADGTTVKDLMDDKEKTKDRDKIYEAKGEKHNFGANIGEEFASYVSSGGKQEPSSLSLVCSKCGCLTRELDHITPDGWPAEVKSGKKVAKLKQLRRNSRLLEQMEKAGIENAKFYYKITDRASASSVKDLKDAGFTLIILK